MRVLLCTLIHALSPHLTSVLSPPSTSPAPAPADQLPCSLMWPLPVTIFLLQRPLLFRFGKPDASQGATGVSEPRAHLPADLTRVCLLPEPTDPTLCHQSLTQSDPYTEDPVSTQRGRWPRHTLSYNHVQ